MIFLHWLFGSIGICLGYHRLLTHWSFSVPKWLEYIITNIGALALQGGPIFWAQRTGCVMSIPRMKTKILIDMCALINNVMEMMELLARTKELLLVVDCDRAFPQQVLTDSLRLQQIVTNLVSNAIRYTQSGTIQLTCSCPTSDEWVLSVCDTGISIAPEDQAGIFDPYFE
jgi:signal transduction histidine kinase